MDLWQIFVLAQVRLLKDLSYDDLHHIANYDHLIRQIMGVEKGFGYERYEFEYQTVVDNVSLLDDETVRELNQVIIEFGHEVFKKKEVEALCIYRISSGLKNQIRFLSIKQHNELNN